MSIFDAKPIYRVASREENLAAAADLPFSPLKNFAEQTGVGVMDSFGLGTAIKDFTTPRGAPQPPGLVDMAVRANPILGPVAAGYDLIRNTFGAQTTGSPMTEADYKASGSYRDGVPWDPGMTTDRAAALAAQYDWKTSREFYGAKYNFNAFGMSLPGGTTLLGNLVGGALDPINYVPVLGPGARAALAARTGSVMAHALIGASEGAINTAAASLITAPMRAKFGDDVSWQASINNVVFGAVAGLVFGGVMGGVDSLRSGGAAKPMAAAQAKIRASIETLRNARDGRAVLNDAVDSMVNTGDVKLTPASGQALQRIADEVHERQTALPRETADVTGSRAGEVVISPSGARVAVRPEVVDLATLQHATGDLQVRDRSGANAVNSAQIEDIAVNLDPARLMPNIDASQGTPLVGADNVIDSGNGRVMALRKVYDSYPEKAAAYRQAIEAEGYSTEGMAQPVLISRRLTDLSPDARASFNAELNSSTTARMSATEIAGMDRRALDDSAMAAITDGPVTAATNRGFVGRFLNNLPQNERGALLMPDGVTLNADGVRRIENALISAAYGDVDPLVVRKFAEATDDNTTAIVGAMSDAAGQWVKLRRAALRGEIDPTFDQTPELTEALRRLSGWRDQAVREKRPVGIVIKEGMSQIDMLSGEISVATKIFIRSFYRSDDFTGAAGRETIAGRLNDLVNASLDAGKPDMFGDAHAATRMGVLKHVYNDLGIDRLEAESLGTGTDGLGYPREGYSPGANRQGGAEPARSSGAGTDATIASAADLKRQQPARTIEQLYEVAPEHQKTLGQLGEQLAETHGAEWRDPGVKSRETTQQKMTRKGYESTAELTDVVRGGFVVGNPDQAEAIVADIAKRFTVVDEGWQVTAAGYFDRKVLVRFDDGTVGEVQLWHPDMYEAKETTGHKLYEQMRGLKPDDPKFMALLEQQRELYTNAIKNADQDWRSLAERLAGGEPASGKVLRNAASDMGRPESITSAASASRQSPPESGLNQAVEPDMIAGRSSQSKNVVSMPSPVRRPVVDMQEPRPVPPPEGLAEAAERVGKPEDVKQLAEAFAVNEDGSFLESEDIDRLRKEGRLTDEDLSELDAADQTYADATAYAETLRVAASCMTA
jgi:hypothetical protein